MHADSQIKILPLGNSITYDNNEGDLRPFNDVTRIAYRKTLNDLLVANWEPNGFDFIGSETSGDPLNMDIDNAGFPGITVAQLASLLETGIIDQSPDSPLNPGYINGTAITTGAYLQDPVYTPDAVLLHIGTNDVANNDVADVERILDAVEAAEGDGNTTVETPVFLALIIDENPEIDATATFNAEVQLMANGRIAGGDNIIVVDMENGAGLVIPDDYVDVFHPTTGGYTKMANAWWNAMDSYFMGADITTTTAPDATESQIYSLFVNTTGVPQNFQYSLSGEPAGMLIDAITGEITWTPDAGDIGDHTFDVVATNFVNEDTQSITLTVTGATSAPAITGITAGNQNTDDKTAIQPFQTTTITDSDGDVLTVSLTLNDNANGQLSTTDFTFTSPDYVFNGIDTDATTAIRALSYTPTENQVEPTNDVSSIFTVSVDDGASPLATDNTTTVVATSVNDSPQISFTGSLNNQGVNDNSTISPFNTVSFSDPDLNASLDVSVTIQESAQGTFTNLGGFSNDGGGLFSFTGDPTAAASNISGLAFDPTENFATPNLTTTTNLQINVSDGIDGNVESGSVDALSINDNPTGSDELVAATEDTDYIFAATDFSSFSDVDNGDALSGIRMEAINGLGTFTNNGGAVNSGDVISTLSDLVFSPAPNESGNNYANFDFRFVDSFNGESIIHNMNVNVGTMMDPPVLTVPAGNLNYNEGDGAVVIDGGITVTDIDDVNLESAIIQITGNFLSTEDELVYTTTNGISGTYTAATGILEFTTPATLADYQAALRAVQYRNNNTDNPNELLRTISFTVNDGDSDSNTDMVTIDVMGSNDAPVLASTGADLNYNEGDNDVNIDPNITVTDVDDANMESATITIITNYQASEDNLLFTNQNGISGSVVGNTMTLTGSSSVANYQTALRSVRYENDSQNPTENARTIRFTVNDGPDDSNNFDRNVNVAGQNDLPVVTTTAGTINYQEGDGAVIIDGGITVSDIDDVNLESATIRITTGFLSSEDELVYTTTNGITGSYNSGTGILTLTASTTVANYQAALRAVQYRNNNTDNPDETQRIIGFIVNDGDDDSVEATKAVDVSGLNDPPVLASAGTDLNYNEGDNDVNIDPNITVTDADDTNMEGATIAIITNYQASEDNLLFTDQNGISGSVVGNTMTLTGSSSLANYQTALRSVRYENDSENPTENARTIRYTVNDGPDDSNNFDRNVNVAGQNDLPVVTTTAGTVNYQEGDGAVIIDGGISVTDADDVNLESATIRITTGFLSSEDELVYTTTNGITGSYNSGTGILTLTASTTVANYQAALRAVQYRNNNTDNPDETQRIIGFIVNDGDDDSVEATKAINVSGLNNAPVLAGTVSDLNYNEGDNDVNIDPGITVTDVDDTNIESAAITIITNYQASEDNLLFTDQNGISGSVAGNTMTLTGSSSLANYQTALRSVRYENDSENPTENARTIRFTVNDGPDDSNNFDRNVNIAGQNDAPVVITSVGTTTYDEASGTPFVAVDGSISVTDADNSNLIGATVWFSDVYIPVEDVLAFTNQNGISGSFVAGTLTLTGSSSVANYQTALISMLYFNNAGANPTGGNREITYTVTDGLVSSTPAVKIVAVATDNSAPTLTNGGIDDVTVIEDAADSSIDLFDEFEDAEDPDADLTFAIDNVANPGLFESVTILPVSGPRNLVINYAENAFGSSNFTISCTDTEGGAVTSTFLVTVSAENDPPTTAGIADVDVDEDAPNTVINLFAAFDDPEDADADLTYTVEENTIPGLFTVVDIDNVAGTLTLGYTQNTNGISSITVRATDSDPSPLSVDASFTVTIASINDEPLLDDIPDPAAVLEDAGPQVINLTGINAGPNETQFLSVTATTTSAALLNVSDPVYTSPQTTATMTYEPVENASGSADIEVCVTDVGVATPPPNDNQVCKTFTVVVESVNDNPTIDPVADPNTIFVNAGEQCVSLTGISAGPGENESIAVSASSSNSVLIANPNTGIPGQLSVNYTSPNSTAEVCYTPLADQFGQSTITITVLDGGTPPRTTVETFNVVVSPVNQEPEIDPVADFAIDEDAMPGPLLLTGISAGQGESQQLEFDIISDNLALFDPDLVTGNISVSYTQGSNEANLIYNPTANEFGTANITIKLIDEGPGDAPNDNEFEISFNITVNPINDAPTLDAIPDQGVFDVGEAPPAINLTGISEGPNENQTLTWMRTSDNQSLIKDDDILITYQPGDDFGALTYTIQPGIEADATISVVLQDSGPGDAPNVNMLTRTFKVSVSSEPDMEITNAVPTINEVSKGQNFRINTSVRNNGNETVESTFLSYYFSANDQFNELEDDLIESTEIGPITPEGGEDIWESDPLEIVESPAGDFYVIIIIDRTNNISELNENNNIFVMPISVNSNRFPQINLTNSPEVITSDADFVNYRVEVSDDRLGASPVKFFYRGISSIAEFTPAVVEDLGSLNFQFSLNRSEFNDPIGIEYFFEVVDVGDLRATTPLAHTYLEYDETGLIFNDLKYGDKEGDYQMVSVPLELQATAASSVFGDDFGEYNKEIWRLFRYQGGANVENEAGLKDGILPGNGYWLIAKNKPEGPVDTGAGTTAKVTKENPFVLSLKTGWNQISSPYNFNVSWDEVLDFNNEPAGVRPALKTYTGSSYDDSDILVSFSGAFAFSDVEIDLEVPVIKNNAFQTGRTFANSRTKSFEEGEWEAKIDLITPFHNSKVSSLGMKLNAESGKDRFDDPSSPDLSFLNHIELRFDHPEYFYKSFTKDFRSVKDAEIWEFTVEGNQEGIVTMDWGEILGKPNQDELYLYDVSQGKVLNMLKLSSYNVNLSKSRVFRVYYGSRKFIEENLKPENVSLGQSFPNPFSNSTAIPFTLAESAASYELDMSVFNLMGQKVKVLTEGDYQSGFYQVEWNGKNENNELQPSGVYIYKLSVKTPEGNEKSYFRRAILR